MSRLLIYSLTHFYLMFLLALQPLFPGDSSIDQLVEIIKVSVIWSKCKSFNNFTSKYKCVQVLGTPTREELKCMNPQNTDFRLPQVKAHPWHKVRSISASFPHPVQNKLHLMFFILSQVFQKHMPPEAVDLVSRLLQYSPSFRPTAVSISLQTYLVAWSYWC